MEGKRKSKEVKIEKCFHYFTTGGGQFSLKQKGKDENREICPLFTLWWSDFAEYLMGSFAVAEQLELYGYIYIYTSYIIVDRFVNNIKFV